MCHDYFSSLGHKKVSFTGLDVAPLAPDLKQQGINWTFVQHDLRRIPLPFDDDRFDLVMVKDMSLVLPLGMASERFIDECIRILEPGGILEIWESDHVLRSLLPHPPAPTKNPSEQRAAASTATFLISPGTPFAPAQNKYLQQANAWIQEALDRRKLPPTPCARIAPILYQEPDTLGSIGARRVAIPLGELRWERDGSRHARQPSNPHDSVLSTKGKTKISDLSPGGLTADQASLRQVALLTVLQMIENLEPILKEASGKNTEEWSHWWAVMMADLMDPSKAVLTGECLEVGAWWAMKLEADK
jgi:SAM-dependent methyltransferase